MVSTWSQPDTDIFVRDKCSICENTQSPLARVNNLAPEGFCFQRQTNIEMVGTVCKM